MLEPSSRAVWVVAATVTAVGIGWIAMLLLGEQRVHDHYKLECTCGKLKMYFKADSGAMKGIICHCKDCRRFSQWVEKDSKFQGQSSLDRNNAVCVSQVTKCALTDVQGAENLQFRRLSEGTPLARMFTGCCCTPIGALFPGMPSVPFFAVYTRLLQPAGSVLPEAQVWCCETESSKSTEALQAEYGVPAADVVDGSFILGRISRILTGFILGKNYFKVSLLPGATKMSDFKSFAPVIQE